MAIKSSWKAWLVYGAATLVVMLPLLVPGFILTLDLVFTPELPLPTHITNTYPFHAALHVLNFVIPSDVLEKLLLVSILLLASFGLHRLVRSIAVRQPLDWGIYIASVFYAINPFTYSRFMAGQYAVLLGYALLPWLARLILQFVRQPNGKAALKLGGLIALVGALSIHTLVAVAILIGVGLAILISTRKTWRSAYLKYGALALGCFVVLSSYWLLPLVLGQGKTATTITSFTAADTEAFATVGEHPVLRLFHVMRLQGFWVEGRGLYVLPQDKTIAWGLMMLGLIALIVTGSITLWRKRKTLVLWFGLSALVGIVLAAGAGAWFADIPLLQGLREPHKMIMLLALFYAVGLAFGVNKFLAYMQRKGEALYSAALVGAWAAPLLTMVVMLWGFNGQLTPRQYPADWFAAKTSLEQTDNNGKILFLPWHQYMSFQFSERIIANPAPAFFGDRIIVNTDPELKGATGDPPDARQQAVTALLRTGTTRSDLATELAAHDIRFIMFAKDLEYEPYDFLDGQTDLHIWQDYPTLKIYENQQWRKD